MSVYAISCAGLLKIGYSDDPAKRTVNLFQSTSRYSAPRAAYEARGTQTIAVVIEGADKFDERAIHEALDDFSIGCEWFVDEPPVRDLLAAFTPGDMPETIERADGPAYEAIPLGEHGGQNVALALDVLPRGVPHDHRHRAHPVRRAARRARR